MVYFSGLKYPLNQLLYIVHWNTTCSTFSCALVSFPIAGAKVWNTGTAYQTMSPPLCPCHPSGAI